MTRVLVCGGRKYDDWKRFNALLDTIHTRNGISCIIQGGATGADWLARAWADNNNVPLENYPAQWENFDLPEWQVKVKYHKDGRPYNAFAGFLRNQDMLNFGRPDLVIAFPGGDGTADMTRRAIDKAIATLRVNPLPGDDLSITFDEEEIPPPSVEWLLPPNPSSPRKPRRAAPTPEGRYESQF